MLLGEYEAGQSRPWTPEEEAHLREARVAGTPWPQVARQLGRTLDQVKGRAKLIRAVEPRTARRTWTPDEDAAAVAAYRAGRVEQFAAESGRPLGGVLMRMTRLGERERRLWTSAELDDVRRSCPLQPPAEIAERLDRPVDEVRRVIRELGLQEVAVYRNRRWTKAEDDALRRSWPDGPGVAVAATGRTLDAVHKRAWVLGLKADLETGEPPLQGPYFGSEMRPPRRWSAEDDALLVELLGDGLVLNDAAGLLGRSYESARQRARAIGARSRRGRGGQAHEGFHRPWPLDHLAFLRRNLGDMSHQEIAWRLDRTTSSVRNRAERMRAGDDLSSQGSPRAKG
jgi:hypothetical protein